MVSGPKAPDPVKTAQAQSGMNLDTALTQQLVNFTNTSGPWGSTNYNQTGTNSFVDSQGRTVEVPQFTQTTSYTPEQQAIFDKTTAAQTNIADIANQQTARLKDYLSSSFNFGQGQFNGPAPVAAQQFNPSMGSYSPSYYAATSGAYSPSYMGSNPDAYSPAYLSLKGEGYTPSYFSAPQDAYSPAYYNSGMSAFQGAQFDGEDNPFSAKDFSFSNQDAANWSYDLAQQRIAPQQQTDRAALETQLVNKGIRPGTAAWNSELERLGRTQNDQNNQLALTGRQQAYNEAFGTAQQNYNQNLGVRQQNYTEDMGAAQFNAGQNLAARQQNFNEGIGTNQLNNANAMAARQLNYTEGFNANQLNNANALAARQQSYTEDLGVNQLNNANAFAARQQNFNEGLNVNQLNNANALAARQQNYNEGIGINQLNNANALAARQQNYSEGLGTTQANNASSLAAQQAAFQQALASRQQNYQEAVTGRNQPLNEITALLSGSQIANPNQGAMASPQTQVGGVDYTGLVNQQYQSQLANSNALMGGLFGLAGTGATAALKYSDARVKQDIRRVGTLDNGLPVYAYRYIWGGPVEIGVMAQDVERVKPDAVHDAGGIKAVDYGMVVA